jgi:hypothetical protein
LGALLFLLILHPNGPVRFLFGSVSVIALIWLVLDLTTRLLIGDSSYGSKKVFQVVLVFSVPVLVGLLHLLSSQAKFVVTFLSAVLLFGFCINRSVLVSSINFSRTSLTSESISIEQKMVKLIFETQTLNPKAHILCYSDEGTDAPSNYLHERAAYICSRHASGYARSVNPYLISTWAIAQTQRGASFGNLEYPSARSVFLRLLEDVNLEEQFVVLNLSGGDSFSTMDTPPGLEWIRSLNPRQFNVDGLKLEGDQSLSSWLLSQA